ncbi:putative Rho GTPase-activating protein [Acorus calamus]|uniref:Rho GTPase-activating protein n=1 Tax=Acorus calamus TaxID=4465 RepID=A0AAV9C8S6_ACOCL|nr:putative Rho GTPase-activating protein [Acorus calamus]
MPSPVVSRWQEKANGLLSSSGVKLKQVGQSAGENVADAAERVGSLVKSRWSVIRQSRQQRSLPVETVQERIVSAAASTGAVLKKSLSETKEVVAAGKVKVGEAAKKTADKSRSLLNNIERWQKGVASSDVFGVPIEITVQRQQYSMPIPHVLVKCADYLILSGLHTEYLFKYEGDRKILQQLISLYNLDSNSSLPDSVNPIDVAALMKCYLASLPEPLTTFALYQDIRNNARCSTEELKNVLRRLSNVNYMTLELITALLLRVSQKSSLNKMDAHSLAVEFAPIIMWRKGGPRPDAYGYLNYSSRTSPKDSNTSTHNVWDILSDEDDDGLGASSLIPLDDSSPPDYDAIQVIQCLIEHHNAIFTDANETTWR